MLAGEVVLITGVGAGLGTRLAWRAAQEGARVVMAARSRDVTRRLEHDITAAGGEALSVACDVRDPAAVQQLVDTAVHRFGTLTGLVNSAYSHPAPADLLETPEAELRRAMDVILFGALTVTRAVVPHMRAAGGGAIVNIGTQAVHAPPRGEAGYAAAKGALATATKALASELGPDHIRVNHAVMSWLDGPPVRSYLRASARQRQVSEQDVYDEIAARTALGRIPTDEACAGPVLTLLSDYMSEVTGASLDINGGEWMP